MSEIRHEPAEARHVSLRAAGELVHRHRHDVHQLIYVSAGVVAIRTEWASWVAGRDRALWVPAGAWHEHRFYGSCVFHTVAFAAEDVPLTATEPGVVAVDALLRELLVAYTGEDLPDDQRDRLRGVLRDRLRHAASAAIVVPTASDPRLAQVCRLVEQDLSTPRTMAWLARQVSTSERTLVRLFRSEFAMTYPQWRTSCRLFHAMVLLAEGATVTRTAHECGWATVSAFVDVFARTTGQTPGRYRVSPGARTAPPPTRAR
jgi:AraC-like DNA-binding protein